MIWNHCFLTCIGGKIFVFTGILNVATNDDRVAAGI
jgi:hypothetical protein